MIVKHLQKLAGKILTGDLLTHLTQS